MNAANAATTSEMISRVRGRIGDIRSRSFGELAALPEVETARLNVLGEVVWLTVYRKAQSQGNVLLVVQASTDRSFNFDLGVDKSNTDELEDDLFHVEGFIARVNGQMIDAPDDLLQPYQPAA